MMQTFLSPIVRAYRAHTALLLKMQNPMAWFASAWWPGGRTAQKARRSSLLGHRATASITAPAAWRAASNVPADTWVSGSISPAAKFFIRSICSRVWTRARSSSSAPRGLMWISLVEAGSPVEQDDIVQQNAAGIRLHKPGDRVQDEGLAGAAGAEEH